MEVMDGGSAVHRTNECGKARCESLTDGRMHC